MDVTALLLSRLQFAFTVSFHIIFPAFTIGLAAWLTVLEALHLATGRPTYRVVFEFWRPRWRTRSMLPIRRTPAWPRRGRSYPRGDDDHRRAATGDPHHPS